MSIRVTSAFRSCRLRVAVALAASVFCMSVSPGWAGPVTAAEGRSAASRPGGGATFVVALQQPPSPDEFVPVSQLPQQEQLPAAPLLIAAYAVVWILLLGYLLMLWRRLARVEQELASMARQVEDQRRA